MKKKIRFYIIAHKKGRTKQWLKHNKLDDEYNNT